MDLLLIRLPLNACLFATIVAFQHKHVQTGKEMYHKGGNCLITVGFTYPVIYFIRAPLLTSRI